MQKKDNEEAPKPPVEPNAFEQEAKEYKDKYLRSLAEMENLKKRIYKEKEDDIRFAIERTIVEFLSPLDNFENALKFADSSSEEIKKWCMGFHMILAQFKEVLRSHGITSFHAIGHPFDPHLHDAMEIEETSKEEEGKILEEFVKGYKSNGRVIRPAKVKVAKKEENKENNHE